MLTLAGHPALLQSPTPNTSVNSLTPNLPARSPLTTGFHSFFADGAVRDIRPVRGVQHARGDEPDEERGNRAGGADHQTAVERGHQGKKQAFENMSCRPWPNLFPPARQSERRALNPWKRLSS